MPVKPHICVADAEEVLFACEALEGKLLDARDADGRHTTAGTRVTCVADCRALAGTCMGGHPHCR